ncbi:hypothetical protein BD309DRAFT_862854 [Dichomitus squalens]|uniref:Uncharacterized protein n=1 Tax=Dichomitus squalens TaxID=114155 RepID=A0A4Q9NTV3_9APHY|nr:hypothetical protein BD309DRAFT_862854 [Dichomitus squalens]TBU54242.1 hypothetical protein BD310DRAFT_828421 [Dichomitus squalens]
MLSLALFVYDYLMTFDSEVALFWLPRRITGSSVIFFLNRYLTLTVQILLWRPNPSSYQVAVAAYTAYIVTKALQYLPWAAFSTLRSYAMAPERYRWPLSASIFALSSVPLVVDMFGDLHYTYYANDPVQGVVPISTISQSMNLLFALLSRFSLVGADLLVLCVTWYRTYETIKVARQVAGGLRNRTFANILLRDGATLLVLNVLHIASDEFATTSVIIWFEEPFTSILTSRFLINLQKVNRKLAGSVQSMSQLPELAFQPYASGNVDGFIGSLGTQLSFHKEDVEGSGEHQYSR